MSNKNIIFDEHKVIHKLKHFLPAQAPLKDFIHHNTLHAFQNKKFYTGINEASEIFGYKSLLSLADYRERFLRGDIKEAMIDKILHERFQLPFASEWKDKMLNKHYDDEHPIRIGALRDHWKNQYHVNLDSLVFPKLFRVLCSYLDQGISIWDFPVHEKGFLSSLRELESKTFSSFFKTARSRELLMQGHDNLEELLHIVVGDVSLFEQYIFDQQFAHQGWSGMVSAIEDNPQTLLDRKKISIRELIVFELLLEIDAMDAKFGENWSPLAYRLDSIPEKLFSDINKSEEFKIRALWQDAFEWSYYDEILAGIATPNNNARIIEKRTFQAMFCIDDRECSLRRYLEKLDAGCETFGTPGFFNVAFYYQPEHGRFFDKLCPAPVFPKHLIREMQTTEKRGKDAHLNTRAHSIFKGWFVTQTLGFWAALKLFVNIFRPSMSPATASSFKHMDRFSVLSIVNDGTQELVDDLQLGFTIDEMADRVEGLLRSIGCVADFADIVYVVGHGSSSVNNPHFSAYDCGACSGRPGSVNARVICAMANNNEVRKLLEDRQIFISDATRFVGGLHDTTRDDITFFDEDLLSESNRKLHQQNQQVFIKALDLNAKERSRRFESINTSLSAAQIHQKVRRRSVSLFEPRPELNHATNALCIVGPREMSSHLFLDRRSFMNSYDYRLDMDGKYLFNILKAVAPVCGGINLEYFFSRVDNQNMGAGTKLPHNVMGLFGVANGTDGDLRPGLPEQMIEVHDPIRLLVIVKHDPDTVLETIQKDAATYEWFLNEWVHLVVTHPDTQELYLLKSGKFERYQLLTNELPSVVSISTLIESSEKNIPMHLIQSY